MDLNLESFLIDENVSIFDAVSIINANGKKIAFVCRSNTLVAVLSDGDIRRYILKNGDISASVHKIANYSPIFLEASEQHLAHKRMAEKSITAIPIVNKAMRVISVIFSDREEIRKTAKLNTPVVIMAGGKGARLDPYTQILPKPLIPVGEFTITEHIIQRLLGYGCSEFHLIVNYKKELIKTYFHEVQYEGSLRFWDELEFQGTGGGLALLEGCFEDTFFMTNCDILIDTDYEDLLAYHKRNRCMVTMVCAMQKIVVSYGTVETNEHGMAKNLVEKPEYPLLTNTGFYVIEPSFLKRIPSGVFIHITDLIQEIIAQGEKVGVYPISENAWMDIGNPEQLEITKRRMIRG